VIAFVSMRNGNDDIYRMQLDSTNVSRLTYSDTDDTRPNWSPDGKWITFMSWRDGYPDIHVMAENGAYRRRVTTDPGYDEFPSWSPDGEWIAFSFFLGGGKGSLALIRPDGTDLRELTDGSVGNFVAKWSPNGEEVSFNSNRSGSYEVWSVHRDGSGLRQMTDTPERHTNGGYWSPDGSLMAFSSDEKPYLLDPRKPRDERTPQALPTGDIPGDFVPCTFSPDGRRLAGHWEGGEEDYQVALYDLETQAYRIFETEGIYPIWLADNRRLLYGAFSHKMYLLDTVSGDVREILSNVRGIFSISRDNRWIYFSRFIQEADIWMLTLNEEQQ
jgi:TolB protein